MNALVTTPATHLAPSVKPRPVENYGKTRLSMEDRFLARMLLAQKKPRAQDPGRKTFTPDQHRRIRNKVLEVAGDSWASSFTIAERVNSDRDIITQDLIASREVIGSKVSELVRQGFMLATGGRGKRVYKLNPEPPKGQPKQEQMEARAKMVEQLVSDRPGLSRRDVMEATGLSKGQAETALETLFKHDQIRREFGVNGRRVFYYFPAEAEEVAA